MNTATGFYPIGTPGMSWGDEERAEWLSRQSCQRSYESEVLSVFERLRSRFDVEEYGCLDYGTERYPLMAIRTARSALHWQPATASHLSRVRFPMASIWSMTARTRSLIFSRR